MIMKASYSKKTPLTENHLFEKFEKLAKAVRQDFKNNGLIIPKQNKDGSVQIGDYTIIKRNNAYVVNNSRGHVVVGPVNLAQTAIISANDLALGRWVDKKILESDQWYGYKAFAEQAANACADKAYKDKDPDRGDFVLGKAVVAGEQKLHFKRSIDSRFDKLCKLT
jgi:hypothetical protein